MHIFFSLFDWKVWSFSSTRRSRLEYLWAIYFAFSHFYHLKGGDGQFWKILLCLLPCNPIFLEYIQFLHHLSGVMALFISIQETRDYVANFSDINMFLSLPLSHTPSLSPSLHLTSLIGPSFSVSHARSLATSSTTLLSMPLGGMIVLSFFFSFFLFSVSLFPSQWPSSATAV